MKEKPQNCWEFWDCSKTKKNACPAFPSDGQKCWEVASSPEKEGCTKAKGRGLFFCVQECAWFKRVHPPRV